jgi:superfamily II DNA or RNA helicase/HKD family nuclease
LKRGCALLNIKLITENLADELIPGIQRATGIYILTSFVMESGVKLLQPHLKQAAERGADIKLLAGDYLFVTQPKALRRLLAIDERLELRLWRSYGTSFHPKAYLFDYGDGQGLMIVGSSNLSRSAFKVGYEWNLAVNAQAEPFTFQQALKQFMTSLYHDQTCALHEEAVNEYERDYNRHHSKFPELARTHTEWEESELMMPVKPSKAGNAGNPAFVASTTNRILPRQAQQMALEAIHATWEEGYSKAMVVMATGLGKTYLAAFVARSFKRVLFIAHREEILQQAQRSFRLVMPERSSGLYNGAEKSSDVELLFASIYTLGIKQHRDRFKTDDFDLIVVDEVHHAAAKSYTSVLSYFTPVFQLGITATPERMDGRDVYALCDGNVAYQIHFIEAITRGWLSPFQYYGIYDDTDYSQITWLGSRYDEQELSDAQLRKDRAELVWRAWTDHKQSRSLGFCSSIRQADFLADYFKEQGVRALSLHSRTTEMSRPEAIRALTEGELDIIFTVDLFNEGVDIPGVDTLLFARPTESLTVFTQQIGRGLRLAEGKTHCVIIDLIGNYRNADLKLSLLGRNSEKRPERGQWTAESACAQLPPGCIIDLEIGVINWLDSLLGKRNPRKENLRTSYLDLKKELGRRPTYLELHAHGRARSQDYRSEFKSYAGFLLWAGELSEEESRVYMQAESWLKEVEGTGMNKSYKMVLLYTMLERGPKRWQEPISPYEAAPDFYGYIMEREYRRKKEFAGKTTASLAESYDESVVARLIADNPMTYWSGKSQGLVTYANGIMTLNQEAITDSPIVYEWTKEICLYRLQAYFERKSI